MPTAVRVDFLTRPLLTDPSSRGRRFEWPPHPHRLFAAMAAAHYEAGVGQRETLEWLERQGPPEIVAGHVEPRTAGRFYVPVNDKIPSQKEALGKQPRDRPLGDLRDRQGRLFPTGVFETEADRTLYYVWPRADSAPPEDLDAILREVTRLGHSSSLVAASLAEEPPPSTWVPDDDGERVFRVPAPGTLAALDQEHRQRSQKQTETDRQRGSLPAPAWQPYGRPAPPPSPRGPWVEGWAWSLEPRAHLSTWLLLAEAVRQTLLARLPREAADVLTGHGEGHHLAVVPLAHVDHPRSRGRVLGFALLAPELELEERRQLLLAMGQLPGPGDLRAGPTGRFTAERTTSAELRSTLRLEPWIRPSRTWATVTPMVFDRFPKSTLPAGRIVAETVERLGLPPVDTVRLSRTSWHPGAPASNEVRVRRSRRPTERPWCHVHLEWSEPVSGPLVLGAMRHFGLGFCRPIREEPGGGGNP